MASRRLARGEQSRDLPPPSPLSFADIAIITVHISRARVCDVNDRVNHFVRDANGRSWSQLELPLDPS